VHDGTVKVVTNQFRLKLGKELSVYQYEVVVSPEVDDCYITHGIFRSIKKRAETILGLYVISGKSIFTTTDLEESVLIQAEFHGVNYDVLIGVDTKKRFDGKSL
jgi:hypothetical protein